MKVFRVFVLTVILMLGGVIAVVAEETQEAEDQGSTTLFHWYSQEKHDWAIGWLYAGLGVVGALVTAFSLIGGVIPGTVGKVRIDAEQKRLDAFYSRLSQLTEADPPDNAAITALNDTVDKLRDDLRKERWRQFWIGFIFYTILGAFFATALAHDLIQAVAVGAAWTSFLGIFGLKSDFAERKAAKDQSLADAEEVIKHIDVDGHVAVGSEGTEGAKIDVFDIPRLRDDIKRARAL
ncbi:MAG: hypothetical protein GY769_17765 [bacterium]|nr:hypothetical protein [bacterium]